MTAGVHEARKVAAYNYLRDVLLRHLSHDIHDLKNAQDVMLSNIAMKLNRHL